MSLHKAFNLSKSLDPLVLTNMRLDLKWLYSHGHIKYLATKNIKTYKPHHGKPPYIASMMINYLRVVSATSNELT